MNNRKRFAACICLFTLMASLTFVTILPVHAAENQETGSAAAGETGTEEQDGNDGRIYVNGKLYQGYYMDQTGVIYIVSKGVAKPKTGTLKAGIKYYECKSGSMAVMSNHTLYVNGKAYTGYYMDSKNRMYTVKKGIRVLADGTANLVNKTLKAGTVYYSNKEEKMLPLSKHTLYVKGIAYTGYYMDSKGRMYTVKKGIREDGSSSLVNKTLKAGTVYYSNKEGKMLSLSKHTLYIKGIAYTGYYTDSRDKMYSVKNGIRTIANNTLKTGDKYYSYTEKKTKKLSKKTVYIDGNAVTGMSAKSLTTLQRAQKIVNRITDDSMTKEEKLKVCFEYVQKYKESRPRTPHYTEMDWPVLYANDMFLKGTGNCFSYAAAFAYMAKAVGYKNVYCCSSGNHGWTEIDGLIYDVQWSREHHEYNYYGLSYDTKTDVQYKWSIREGKPWMHIKL
ncbi:MAG: hypothetical protein NC225_00520 [Clostridium sp.]|nr:hypothetical protein [Clostridium sp.]MCM1459420.1 hypothetical protein [Bacteroides sp.]